MTSFTIHDEAPPPTSRQLAKARLKGKVTETTSYVDEDTRASGDRVNVTTGRPGMITLYRPTDYGWMPQEVPETRLDTCLDAGWATECQDCRGHCGQGEDRADLNSCPGRELRQYDFCPRCSKKFFDPQPDPKLNTRIVEDENRVSVYGSRDVTTPAIRIRANIDEHILAYHPNDAPTYGIAARAG